MGIEPTQSAWKAEILPLNYTRRCTFPDQLRILYYLLARLSILFRKFLKDFTRLLKFPHPISRFFPDFLYNPAILPVLSPARILALSFPVFS